MTSGCVGGRVSEHVVLDALQEPMGQLASAAHKDGGPETKAAARKVIAIYDAGVLTRRY